MRFSMKLRTLRIPVAIISLLSASALVVLQFGCASKGHAPIVYKNLTIAEIRAKAEAGDPYYQGLMSDFCEAGYFVQEDIVEAEKWAKASASANHPFGVLLAGYMNTNNIEGAKQMAQSINGLTKLAQFGDPAAQNQLGWCYYKGFGVQRDATKATPWYGLAAEQGYAMAQFNLGISYLVGAGVEKNKIKAFEWLGKAAEQGFALAQYEMYKFLNWGIGVGKNHSKAVAWLKKAAAQGYTEAQNAVELLGFDINVAKARAAERDADASSAGYARKVAKVEKQLQSAIARVQAGYKTDEEAVIAKDLRTVVVVGDPKQKFRAMSTLITMHQNLWKEFPNISYEQINVFPGCAGHCLDKQGWPADKALDVTLREARLLSTTADINLDTSYRYNTPWRQRYNPRIIQFYIQLAIEGESRAQYKLGEFLLEGVGVPVDRQLGLTLLEISGNDEAYFEIAMDAYKHGDIEKAKVWLLKAASDKNSEAIYNLGVIAQQEKRYDEAVKYFQRTLQIDDKHHDARTELGRMYANGWGVAKNPKLAAEMMMRVAKEADGKSAAVAETNLGFFYLEGAGVEKSKEKALYYLKKASAAGIPEATACLRKIEGSP